MNDQLVYSQQSGTRYDQDQFNVQRIGARLTDRSGIRDVDGLEAGPKRGWSDPAGSRADTASPRAG